MVGTDTQVMKLAELAQKAGVPPRTIRWYISRGLLEGPLRGGRGAVYGAQHLEALRRIKELQGRGLMLSEIARVLAGEKTSSAVPEAVPWVSYSVAPDVVVLVRGDSNPWRRKLVLRLLEEMVRLLSQQSKKGDASNG